MTRFIYRGNRSAGKTSGNYDVALWSAWLAAIGEAAVQWTTRAARSARFGLAAADVLTAQGAIARRARERLCGTVRGVAAGLVLTVPWTTGRLTTTTAAAAATRAMPWGGGLPR